MFVCGCVLLTDTEIKQQLSSLLYVKTICENSIDRLNKGLDCIDFMVSSWVCHMTVEAC